MSTTRAKHGPDAIPHVSELMTRPAVTVHEDLSLDALTQLFLERGLSRVPVIDDGGRAIGIVTKTDLLEDSTDHTETIDRDAPRLRMKGGIEAAMPNAHLEPDVRTVGDVMTKDPITVPAEAPVWMAAALLTERGLHGLPVIATNGRVVGMISSTDVVRWVSNSR